MIMLEIIVRTLLTFAAGAMAIAAVSWFFWSLLKLVRHPEWGPCLVFAASLVLLRGRSGSNQLAMMAVFFSGFFALLFWPEGRAWRARLAARQDRVHGAD